MRRNSDSTLDVPLNPPENAPGFIPAMPTSPQELMAAWGIGSDGWESTTVKTSRAVRGSNVWTLLSSVPLPDWNLEDVAARFGPGSYKIVCGNGPNRLKNCTVHVSPEFAEASGWAAAPPVMQAPDPLQVHAAQTFRKVTDSGAVSREELAAMIQVAVNNARPPAQESGLDSFLKGFNIANELSLKAMENAKNMLGIEKPHAEETSWPAVIMELAPTILGTLKQAFTAPAPAPAQLPPPSRPAIATTTPPEVPPMQPPPPAAQYPPPPAEIVPLIRMMQQFAPMLRGPMEGPEPPESLADQLCALVGPAMDDAVIAAAAHVQQHGPAIFGHAAPWLVSDRAAAVIVAWAAKIQE